MKITNIEINNEECFKKKKIYLLCYISNLNTNAEKINIQLNKNISDCLPSKKKSVSQSQRFFYAIATLKYLLIRVKY